MTISLMRQLAAVVVAAVIGTIGSAVQGADAPAAAKVSTFAPAADLVEQVSYFVGRIQESLSDKAEFDDAKQSRVKKDASTLAVIALALGMHDQDHAFKGSAAGMLKQSQALADASDDFEKANAALSQLKKALESPSTAPATMKWQAVAPLGVLMKQVPLIHTTLKRNVSASQFKKKSGQAAGQAATLAAIAEAAAFDTHVVHNSAESEKWLKFCAEFRDAAAGVNSAAHDGNEAKVAEGMKRLNKACDDCHAVFRKEEE